MVKKLLSIAMLFMPLYAFSGNLSYPLLKEGRTWVYEYHDFDEEEEFDHDEEVFDVSYTIQGDTLIGGVLYSKLMRLQNGTSTYYAALREEGTAVFKVMAGKSNEYKSLEFDPTKLSSMPNIYIDYTERKEVIRVNGREFVRHIYEAVDDPLIFPKLIAVEGVGFRNLGILYGVFRELPTCHCDYESFKACYEDGECIFTNEDFNTTDVIAQTSQLEYSPYAQDEKSWESRVGLIPENIYYNRIDGDTLINGETWKKVYNYMYMSGLRTPSYYAAIRDVDKKVYAIAKGSNRPRLLYDFGLNEGDMVMCGMEGNAFGCLLDKDEQPDTLLGFPFIGFLRVDCIDTIKAHGLEHRRFTLTLLNAFQDPYRIGEEGVIKNVVWIEGVGSGAGPFSPWQPLPPEGSLFLSCSVDGAIIFGYPDFYESYDKHGDDSNGDANGDGVVNAADIVKIVNAIMGQ